MTSMYHEELDRYISVADDAVPIFLNSGWVEQEDPNPEEEPNPAQPASGVDELPASEVEVEDLAETSEPDGSESEEH